MSNCNTDSQIHFGPVVYLARHGETEYNRKKMFQGRSDIPLNENGIIQAKTLKDILKPVPLTRAYISPLERAKTTAGIILEDRAIPRIVEERLTEIFFGVWEGTPEADVMQMWQDDYMDYRNNMERFHPQGGEAAVEAQSRAGRWWDEISCEFSDPDEHILVVAHQSLNAVLACYIAGLPLNEAWNVFKSKPGEVIKIVPTPIAQITRLIPDYS